MGTMVDPTSFTVAVVGLASAIGAAGIALRSKKIEVSPSRSGHDTKEHLGKW